MIDGVPINYDTSWLQVVAVRQYAKEGALLWPLKELANGDGFPTYANADIQITITSSDSGVVSITTSQITIVKGSYFAIGNFATKQEGTAQISAASPSMQSISTPVTVQTQDSPQTIQAYVYPQTLSASSAANGYLVVQLHDSAGNPAKAKEDVPIQVQITNSSGVESINTSGQNTVIQANGPLIVKKDSYWAAIPISVNAGLSGTYSVSISAKGFVVSAPTQITVSATNALFDDKSARVDILPILATGELELIGVLHLRLVPRFLCNFQSLCEIFFCFRNFGLPEIQRADVIID